MYVWRTIDVTDMNELILCETESVTGIATRYGVVLSLARNCGQREGLNFFQTMNLTRMWLSCHSKASFAIFHHINSMVLIITTVFVAKKTENKIQWLRKLTRKIT